jgi:outer membrane protein OmpA-like peptidoglycan-associated protein
MPANRRGCAKALSPRLLGACLLAVLLAVPSQGRAREPWLLDLEATVGSPLSKPQTRWYGVGGSLALSVQKPLASWVALTARVRTAGFLDGESPLQAGVKDPGFGTLNVLGIGGVFRVPTGDVRRATGLWLDAVGGGGFTGSKGRGTFEFGVGYGFALTPTTSISPVLRYLQVVQPKQDLSSADAKIGLLGVRISLFDARAGKAPAAPDAPPLPDRDGDGIHDAVDQCIDVPEDKDGYEDADGCPEVDNDHDGILDPSDGCPNIAEDKDGFQDEDGCLDDDNDRDGFLDADDQCPLEPETVNGERDDDGCPDTGLIVMQDDRIVLEERVLFDTDRAHVNKSADAVLKAIVRLWQQHPEWTKVRIEGHADARGDESFNKTLSERRAANVRDALIKRGMKPEMVTAEGYGATQLLSQGTEERDHQLNRRVEFVVTSREMPSLQPKPPAPDKPIPPAPVGGQPVPESNVAPTNGEPKP